MKSITDVRKLLIKYGAIIYIGDRVADLELMQDELRELYRSNILEASDFQSAMIIIRNELSKLM
ncbi:MULTISPECIES: YqgQ family protein [Sutcliffiella]|nr:MULTISPECIES: YqgQ family protein [Sutcliffiella]MED4019064.1 YqgQ family protein [Sutcliffiella cohnii]WBL13789.1 YqgQ family protein [Sutcliffiella sp. NC1]